MEAFERAITGRQEETNNDLIYDFLDYVLSDISNREKLKELTEIHLKVKGNDIEETENPDNKNDSLDNLKEEKSSMEGSEKNGDKKLAYPCGYRCKVKRSECDCKSCI